MTERKEIVAECLEHVADCLECMIPQRQRLRERAQALRTQEDKGIASPSLGAPLAQGARVYSAQDFGFAPGSYFCRCSACKADYEGDKRSWACETCAVTMAARANASASEQARSASDPNGAGAKASTELYRPVIDRNAEGIALRVTYERHTLAEEALAKLERAAPVLRGNRNLFDQYRDPDGTVAALLAALDAGEP